MFTYAKNILITSACTSLLLACGGANNTADADQDDIYYANKYIEPEAALDTFTSQTGRLKNPNHANINSNLDDWQLLDLTAYAMHVYDLSQQTHNLAFEHFTDDLSDEKTLLSNIITERVTGFTRAQFDDLIDIQDLCKETPDTSSTPFSVTIYEAFNTTNATERNAKVRFNLNLQECHYDYKEGPIEREQITWGDLTYDNLTFTNEIGTETETTLNFQSHMHGKWLILSDTMGYEDSLGYWFIENFDSTSNYDTTDQDPQVKTTNLRTDFYLRDGYRNFDHLYKMQQPTDSTIYTHLGAQNPYSGSIEIHTDHEDGRKLVIKFSENTVDILINDDIQLNDVPWEDIRARKLDMTFDYAND